MAVTPNFRMQLAASLARESFVDFVRLVRPGYIFNFHNLALMNALQELAERKYKRLFVFMPPRHGKSEIVSRLFPAWCFCRNINEQVILASYSIDLASAMNRDCQGIIMSEGFRAMFPDVKLSEGKDGAIKTSKRFDIVGGKGYYLAAGVGGGITGAGATVGIIDDPVKNSEEADSQTYRDKAEQWYSTTFYTRLEPGAVEVICQTRWHQDDLSGRLLQQIGEGTRVISMPALAESQEENRAIGDPLFPARYDRQALLDIKKQIGTRAWNALYQQRPTDEEGGLIKRHWFQSYDVRTLDLSKHVVNFYADTAYTDKEKNDPFAAIAYVKIGADFYIVDCVSLWIDFPAQVAFLPQFAQKNGYNPRRSVIRVEPKATGKSLVQVLKKDTSLNIKEGAAPKESKTSRVNSVSGAIEAGRVFLPSGFTWAAEFIDECAAFPNSAHDDRVDCLTGMLLSEGVGKMKIHY